jgi:hypothetical protein
MAVLVSYAINMCCYVHLALKAVLGVSSTPTLLYDTPLSPPHTHTHPPVCLAAEVPHGVHELPPCSLLGWAGWSYGGLQHCSGVDLQLVLSNNGDAKLGLQGGTAGGGGEGVSGVGWVGVGVGGSQ